MNGLPDMWLDDLVKHIAWGVVCLFLAWGWVQQARTTDAITDALGSLGFRLEECVIETGARLDTIEAQTEVYLSVYDDVFGRAEAGP